MLFYHLQHSRQSGLGYGGVEVLIQQVGTEFREVLGGSLVSVLNSVPPSASRSITRLFYRGGPLAFSGSSRFLGT